MRFKKITVILFFISKSILSQESIEGSWFSEKRDFRRGFEFLELSMTRGKFILAKLAYNEEKKWEETRMLGIIEEGKNGIILLKPENCSIYATKKLGLRWILIQGFDCDHIEIQITKDRHQISISPSIGILEKEFLMQKKNKSENEVAAVVVWSEGKLFYAWGLGIRNVRRKSSATILSGKTIKILETVDSTGSFESIEPIQIGENIFIINQKSMDFFE
jgi:hypothetical protein